MLAPVAANARRSVIPAGTRGKLVLFGILASRPNQGDTVICRQIDQMRIQAAGPLMRECEVKLRTLRVAYNELGLSVFILNFGNWVAAIAIGAANPEIDINLVTSR